MSVRHSAPPTMGIAAQESVHTAERSPLRPRRERGWWLPWAAALAGAVMFLLVRTSITDDGYITLAYAKNLAVHGEWGLVPGRPANSETSPLNVLLLGLLTFLTRIGGSPHAVLALGALNVLASAVLGWCWMRLTRAFRLPLGAAVLGVVLVLVNPFMLSATGLEVLLIPAVLMLLTVFAVEGRPALFGLAAGLAVLTRLDLILFVLLITASAPAIRRQLKNAVLAAVAVAGPWYLFSWFAFGSAVPDTLIIKQASASLFAPWTYFTGPLMYYMSRPVAVLLTFAPAVLGAVALAGWFALRFAVRWKEFPPLGPVAALGTGGVAYFVVYTYLDVGPYHWYYVTPLLATGAFAVVAFGVWSSYSRERAEARPGPPLLALGLAGALAVANLAVDVSQGVPWPSPVIFGNWASATDYARVGRELGQRLHGAAVASPGEIGTLAYYCECTIVDDFSDRGQVAKLLNQRMVTASPGMKLALRVNYFWFDRSRVPVVPKYRLLYGEGPASGPDTWQVYSDAKGVGHFTMVPEG